MADCEKYNTAILHGWRVLRFVPRGGTQWLAGAIEMIRKALSDS